MVTNKNWGISRPSDHHFRLRISRWLASGKWSMTSMDGLRSKPLLVGGAFFSHLEKWWSESQWLPDDIPFLWNGRYKSCSKQPDWLIKLVTLIDNMLMLRGMVTYQKWHESNAWDFTLNTLHIGMQLLKWIDLVGKIVRKLAGCSRKKGASRRLSLPN